MVYLVPVSLGSWPGTKLSLVLKEICISIEALNKQNGNRYNINFARTRCKVSRIYKNKKNWSLPSYFFIWHLDHAQFVLPIFIFFRFDAVGYKTSILIVFLRFYPIFICFFSYWDTREARRRCFLSLIPCFIPFPLRTTVWWHATLPRKDDKYFNLWILLFHHWFYL